MRVRARIRGCLNDFKRKQGREMHRESNIDDPLCPYIPTERLIVC